LADGTGTKDRIVAFFGAGYDNLNEDMRYGNTQSFSSATVVDNGNIGHDANVSPDVVSTTGSAVSPQGRGIYAVELAYLDSSTGAPTILSAPTKIWGATYGTGTATSPNKYYSNMNFSFPGEITAMDVNSTGYTTRLYTADTGGNIWRFDVGDNNPANWTGRIIFSSNPGYPGGTLNTSDTGRKIFYKPSVVSEAGYTMIFFGTGDREHPRNLAVTDRIYALKDKGQQTSDNITESNLMDVTLDALQTTTDTSGSNSVQGLMNTLNGSANYGWYIQLNQNTGEKVLATPLVFNKIAYFTTYTPAGTVANADPCVTSSLGPSRMYALNYKTGEAVLNYDTTNDAAGTTTNRRAIREGVYGDPYNLFRSDRTMTTGNGIPSGAVMVINPNGTLKLLTGIGGALRNDNPVPGGSIVPLYWRQQ
jgi:type IV pilus assembly protein PilY1